MSSHKASAGLRSGFTPGEANPLSQPTRPLDALEGFRCPSRCPCPGARRISRPASRGRCPIPIQAGYSKARGVEKRFPDAIVQSMPKEEQPLGLRSSTTSAQLNRREAAAFLRKLMEQSTEGRSRAIASSLSTKNTAASPQVRSLCMQLCCHDSDENHVTPAFLDAQLSDRHSTA